MLTCCKYLLRALSNNSWPIIPMQDVSSVDDLHCKEGRLGSVPNVWVPTLQWMPRDRQTVSGKASTHYIARRNYPPYSTDKATQEQDLDNKLWAHHGLTKDSPARAGGVKLKPQSWGSDCIIHQVLMGTHFFNPFFEQIGFIG